MIKNFVLLIGFLLMFSCVANAGVSAIEILSSKFYAKDYSDVKAALKAINKKELTPSQGVLTPDGGEYNLHKYLWNSKDGVDCILMLYVIPSSNIIDDVGITGNSYKTVDDPDNAIRDRRRREHENVCIAGN